MLPKMKVTRPADLPSWAQQSTEIKWLCGRDLAFRVNVHQAQTAAMRRVLRKTAEKLFYELFYA